MGRSPGKAWQLKGSPAQEEQLASLPFPASWLSSHPSKEHTFIPSNWDSARRGLSARRIRKDFKTFKSMRLVTETSWEKKPQVVHLTWCPENPVGIKSCLSERQTHCAHSGLSRHRNQPDPAGRGGQVRGYFPPCLAKLQPIWVRTMHLHDLLDERQRKAETLLWIKGNQRDMTMISHVRSWVWSWITVRGKVMVCG